MEESPSLLHSKDGVGERASRLGTKEKLEEENGGEGGKKKKEIKDFESHSISILPKGNSATS